MIRIVWSALAATSIMLVSLRLVAGLNADADVPEPEAELPMPRTVAIAAPPPEIEPLPAPAPPVTPTTLAERPPPQPVRPPPPAQLAAAPPVAGLAPGAGIGSIRIGSVAGLPSVGALPSLGKAEQPKPSDKPTVTARATHRPAPRYPAVAERRGIEGFVTLRLRVDERGRVTEAVVVKSEPKDTFDKAAIDAAKRYRFSPARAGTRAVQSTVQQTIRFQVE